MIHLCLLKVIVFLLFKLILLNYKITPAHYPVPNFQVKKSINGGKERTERRLKNSLTLVKKF